MLSWPALVGVLVLLIPATSRAQALLTVDQAIDQALAQNAALRARRAGLEAREARIDEARSGWFPRLSVAEAWQRSNQPVVIFSSLLASRRFTEANFAIDALTQPRPASFSRASISIDQKVFDGGQQRAVVERARSERDLERFAFDEARSALVISTTKTYGRVLAGEAGRRAAEAALVAAREDRFRVGNRRDAGMATDADVLALEAYVADLDQRRIRHASDAAIACAELNQLMGASIDQACAVVEPSRTRADVPAALDLDVLFVEAEANRPEIRRAAAAARLIRAERASARAALVPHVTAQAVSEVNGTNITGRASSWTVGAEARWSLSLGGAERARLKAAASEIARIAAEADEVRAAVRVEVVTAVRTRQSAAARLIAGEAAVAHAREAERMVRDRFEAGLATVTDLLRASGAVLDAGAQHIAASVDALVSEAQLARSLGRHP